MEHITAPRPAPTLEDFFSYRKIRELRDNYFEQRGHDKEPKKFYVRSDHFLRLFNEDFKLKGDKAVSRRTLQFYSSPQARLFPLPTYKNRHTAYYLFPDHYELLGAIWNLRNKLYLPIDMIRALLKLATPDTYLMITHWDETPEALLDIVMMAKAGLDVDDMELYTASRGIIGDELLHGVSSEFSEAQAKKALLTTLEAQYLGVRKWIESGRAMKCLAALAKTSRELTDFRERLRQVTEKEGDGARPG